MRTPLTLAFVAALQLLASISYLLLVLAVLGVGQDSDAFLAAQAVPSVLTAMLALSLQNVWQPRLAVSAEVTGAWRLDHRAAHAQALLASIAAVTALGLTASLWVPALFAGFDAATRAPVLQMTAPLLLACVFNCGSAVLTTAQRGRDRLVSAEVVALLASVLSLAVVLPAMQVWGVLAAAYVMLARAVLVWLALQCLVGGSSPLWRAGWQNRTVWRQLRPLLASSTVYKAAPLVDRFWSSLAPAGSLTLFSLAQTGMGALTSVLERSLCVPATPKIARCIAGQDAAGARRHYRRAVLAMALASGVVALVLALAAPWWDRSLALLLGLPSDRAHVLWILCGLLLGYLFVGAAGSVVVSVFYALGDTRTPALIGLAGFVLGVLAKSAGFLWLGIEGLALATSLYYLVNLTALMFVVERRIDRLLVPGRRA